MRAWIDNDVLFLHRDDVPQYKKKGSVVRNTYFWALRAIAGRANFGQEWEYESEVWLALRRVLLSFTESGYLGLSETILEFPLEQGEIPPVFRLVSTFAENDSE
ncbi:MAG: hypothetical protein Kow00121_29290 [Elainellaceae cyanobacterium]